MAHEAAVQPLSLSLKRAQCWYQPVASASHEGNSAECLHGIGKPERSGHDN